MAAHNLSRREMIAAMGAMAVLSQEVTAAENSQPKWPFDPNHQGLYTRDELWKGYDSVPANNSSLDWKIYEYFVGRSKYAPPREELIAQRTHDTNIDLAVNEFLQLDETAAPNGKKVVVFVGSHSQLRDDQWYKRAAELAFELFQAGYYVVSGGGPGMMEATHVGVWMSRYGAAALADALSILATTSKPPAGSPLKQYEMPDYWNKSVDVTTKYPAGNESLGVPTWFYGHEGANAFSTHVAKYFSNALREEKICAVGIHGTIFLPGGPGTAQEAFMDAAENAYASYNWFSPMVFYSDQATSTLTKGLIETLIVGKKYESLKMITAAQQPTEVVSFLKSHPPVNNNPPQPPTAPKKMFRRAD
jgi:predicted Rossmann-fold nucleotide-binding protein